MVLPTGGQADELPDDPVDGGGRVVDGGAQSQTRHADGDAHVVEELACLRLAWSAGRDAVEDAEEAGGGRDGADHVDGGGHGLEVVDGGPAGDDDGREVGLAAVAPAGGRGLGIEVDDGGGEAVADGRAGDGERERGLARSALLRDDRDGFHACGLVRLSESRGQCTGRSGA